MSALEVYFQGGRCVLTLRILPYTCLEAGWALELQPEPPASICSTAVRASGVLLLLGVGTLVCYRLYSRYTRGEADDTSASGGDPDGWRGLIRSLLGVTWQKEREVIEDADDISPDEDIQVHYFGPSEYYGPPLARSQRPVRRSGGQDEQRDCRLSPPGDQRRSSSSASTSSDTNLSQRSYEESSLPYQADHSASCSVEDQYCSDGGSEDGDCSSLEPDGMGNKSSRTYEPVFYNKDAGVIFNRLAAEQLAASGAESTSSPAHAVHTTTTNGQMAQARQAEIAPSRRRVILPRPRAGSAAVDRPVRTSVTSAESSGSAASPRAASLPPVSPQHRRLLRLLAGEPELARLHSQAGSFDSSCSDLSSLDLAWADQLGGSTVDLLDRLEAQLDALKGDVTAMDSSLGTLHCPQSQRPAGPRRQVGRSASEYRLRSESSLPAPAADSAVDVWQRGGDSTDVSLEWDSPVHGWGAVPRPVAPAPPPVVNSGSGPPLSRSQSVSSGWRRSPSLDLRPEDLPSLEWDNTGIQQYPEVWQDEEEDAAGHSAGLDGQMGLPTELDLEAELERGESASLGSRLSGSVPLSGSVGDREGSVSSSSSNTVQDTAAGRHRSPLALALGDDAGSAGSGDQLTESGYEGLDSSGFLMRTPLSPLAETPLESTPLSPVLPAASDDAVNGNRGWSDRRSNRDSAYWDDGLDTLAARAAQESVGEPMDLLQYCQQEWRGTTQRAVTIRQGYKAMATDLNLTYIQRVRGDNYCAVRAALYQLLVEALPLPDAARCQQVLDAAGAWVSGWSFGSRLPYDTRSAKAGIRDCLASLGQLTSELTEASGSGRARQLRQLWNSDPDTELRCLEAVKLHMLAQAVRLEADNNKNQTVPVFAMLLFARDTSTTSQTLMLNHLNHVGDTGGLEQIEMYLLGHTLGVRLRVIRPGSYGQSDFITFFPELEDGAALAGTPQLTLVAEDDRHYNLAS